MNCSRAFIPALLLVAATAFAEEAPVAAPEAAVEAAAATAVAEATDAATDATTEVAAPASGAVEIGKPEAGKGQVVFFRPSKMTGALIGFKVRENDKELGVLKNGNYFVLSVEPGKHEYVVHSEAKDKLTLEVEVGEVYYVAGSISMGIMAGRPNLAPSHANAFEAVRSKLKQSSL